MREHVGYSLGTLRTYCLSQTPLVLRGSRNRKVTAGAASDTTAVPNPSSSSISADTTFSSPSNKSVGGNFGKKPCSNRADSEVKSRPPNETHEKPRRRKKRELISTVRSAVTTIEVDPEAIVSEWQLLMHIKPSLNPMCSPSSYGIIYSAALARSYNPHTDAHAKTPATTTSKTSLEGPTTFLAEILKAPHEYPQMHSLFHSPHDEDNSAPRRGRMCALPVVELKLNSLSNILCGADTECTLSLFLSFLRMYRRLSSQSMWMTAVYQKLLEAFLSEASRVWSEISSGWQKLQGESGVLRRCAWVMLELYCIQLDHNRHAKATSQIGKNSSKSVVAMGKAIVQASSSRKSAHEAPAPFKIVGEGGVQMVEPDWKVNLVRYFLEGVVQPILAKLTSVLIDIDPNSESVSVSDLCFRYYFVLLAVELRKRAFCQKWTETAHNTMRCKTDKRKDEAFVLGQWNAIAEEGRSEIQKTFSQYTQVDPEDTGSITIENFNSHLEDSLLALHITQAFALIVPQDFQQYVQVQATRILHLSCRAVRFRPDIFLFLCSEAFAYQLDQLKQWPGGPYGQMCTDVFAAAAVFLELRAASLPALLDEKEATRQAALRAANPGLSEDQLPPRPLLHGVAAQLFYAMLCVGYAPEVVLQNAVYLSMDSLELVSITAATALFSMSFATNPLPVRVRATLMDAALDLSELCMKSARRLSISHTEILMQTEKGQTSLFNRLERFAMQPLCTKRTNFFMAAAKLDTKRRSKINFEKPKSDTRLNVVAEQKGQLQTTEVVTLDEMNQLVDLTLYTVLCVAVEFLTRGDESTSRNLILNLFPILERENSTVYLVEALEVLTTKIAKRLAYVGGMEIRADNFNRETTSIHCNREERVTTLTMEQGFSEVVALFQQRVSATIFHRLTRTTNKKGSSSLRSLNSELTTSKPFSSSSDSLSVETKKGGIDDGTITTAVTGAIANPVLSVGALLELIFRFTACAVICGMDMNTVKQLTSVHTMLIKVKDGDGIFSSGSGKKTPTVVNTSPDVFQSQDKSADDAFCSAFQVVEQLGQLMTCVAEKRFPITRHPQSAHIRTTNIALNYIVAVNLKSIPVLGTHVYTPTDIHNPSIASLSKNQRRFALSIIHLLFRLSTNHPVEAEPTALRVFRTDMLDPVVAQVLRESTSSISSNGESNQGSELPLTLLTEIAVVMCVPHTIHLVSRDLYTGLSNVIVQIMKTSRRIDSRSSATGAIVQRLLCASSTVCLRGDPQFTTCFLETLQATESHLTLRQNVHVLDEMLARQVPTDALPVRNMLQRLVQALSEVHIKSGRPMLSLPDCIATLRTLARYDGLTTANTVATAPLSYRDQKCSNNGNNIGSKNTGLGLMVPYGRTLARLCRSENIQRQRITLSEYGELVHIAAVLGRRTEAIEACEPVEKELIQKLPRLLSVPVLRSPQTGMEHDTPAVLSGYAEVTNDEAVRAQVLRAFISRTIRACPALSPGEVVQCVEAYCAAGIYHEYLFSVLLGRVADITQRFSLDLSLRLLRCGICSGHPLVKTACVTAAKPVFVAHVRHILQSDPSFITSVGLTSTSILRCLRDCFPREPICAAVLENIAAHTQGMSGVGVIKAALELIAIRGSQDYNTLRTLSDYTTSVLICTSSPRDLADLVFLLVACGVRSGALLTSTAARFSEVRYEADGYTLARIMEALQRACVDVDNKLFSQLVARIIELVDKFLNSAEDLRSKKRDEVGLMCVHDENIEPPFTASQVSVILSQLYTGGKHHLLTVMPAVDALLKYLSRLWIDSRFSSADGDYSAHRLVAREVETILRSCVEQTSQPAAHRDVLRVCADQLNRLLDVPQQQQRPSSDVGVRESGDVSNEVHKKAHASIGGISFDNFACNSVHSLEECISQNSATSALWRGDLLMLVNLASFLTRGGEVTHPVLRRIFTLVFEKRATLLKRHLLFETVKQTMRAAGEEVHPALHNFVVKGKLL
ncbi:unnamed protein product [Phytomonas sp. EM1]|nr:unnamed protein product [Phytomonas sp. EM1]|eukprot:CCW61467.1 unnamed protein product [Phytomonas sp. isolate EM1]